MTPKGATNGEQSEPACVCGQGRVWHDKGTGRCLLTGPQSGDGCPCESYRPAMQGRN